MSIRRSVRLLRYIEFCLSHEEVPEETALCIYISGCPNRCPSCHYPEMQQAQAGKVLSEYYGQMLDLYHEYTTCVCFMGEGANTEHTREELLNCVNEARGRGYKCCLYSGRNVTLEEWMQKFDYVKLGSYMEECGSITSRTTNQRMYMKGTDGVFVDITERFWDR